MKALTLWQPWASLIAVGAKQYETRSWQPAYRGPVVIHASIQPVSRNYIAESVARGAACQRALGGIDPSKLPLGAALCVADLVAVYPTEELENGDAHLRGGKEYLLASDELHFGNFSDGRYAWRFVNVRRFLAPVRMTGRQRLFDLTPVEARAVEDALAVWETMRLEAAP